MVKVSGAAARALSVGVLLLAASLGGCVTASRQGDNHTRTSVRSGMPEAVTSTHAPRRTPEVMASPRASVLLTAYGGAAPPDGAAALCSRYPWACSSQGATRQISEAEILSHARRVNSTVNRRIRPATDRSLYGRDEYWTLPKTAGDCEDYALEKMRLLIGAGVPARNLFIATALNRRMEHHVVLVLRTSRGDLILDNLTSSIRTWPSTGYTYLKRQNPANKRAWEAVLLGPRASRA